MSADQHVPFSVTAHLPAGYSASDPWSPSLEGLLAYWMLREQLGEEAFALGSIGVDPMRVIGPDDLPLAVDRHEEAWWWVASSPIVASVARFPRWFHRRFDLAEAATYTAEAARTVNVKGGQFKNYRIRREVVLTPTLTWHAMGDPDEVRRLLRRCTHIGYGGAKGYGEVARWEVAADGADESLARTYRPLPAEAATLRGIGGIPMRWGIRPPGRLPEHQILCMMPEPRG